MEDKYLFNLHVPIIPYLFRASVHVRNAELGTWYLEARYRKTTAKDKEEKT